MRSKTFHACSGNFHASAARLLAGLLGRAMIFAASLSLFGCGLLPEKLPYTDPRVQKLIKAADRSSECRFAFTPISRDSDIRLERSTGDYDLMLHVKGTTDRTIAYRVDHNGIRWIGEQETYKGPKQYTNVDGTFPEEIVVTFEIESVSGVELNCLNIRYMGDDPRLAGQQDIQLETVMPILREWGYDVELIGAPIEGQLIHFGPGHPALC